MKSVKGGVEDKIQKQLVYLMQDRIGNQAWSQTRQHLSIQVTMQLRWNQVEQNVKL